MIGLGTAVVQLDTSVNIAFPAITRGFDLAIGDIQWVVICYVLTYASLLLALGRIGDTIGHARVFRIGLIWSAVALLLVSCAPTYGAMLVFRCLQGVGAALVLSCGVALVTSLYGEERRSRALGVYTMMMAFGLMLGPLLGGALTAIWDWPAVFWFRIPIALAALLLTLGALAVARAAELGDKSRWMLGLGIACLIGAVACLVASAYGARMIHVSALGADCVEKELRDEHRAQPLVVSITQSTEMGTLYSVDEIAALVDVAHRHGMKVHLDGARLANATVALGVDVRQFTVDVGVDVLTFGGTKNGMMYGEAVVFLDAELGRMAQFVRKQAAQLPSKMRYVSAQFEALLTGDLWLTNARAANLAAQEIAAGAKERLMHPVEANEVFLIANRAERESLRAQGFAFYDWDEHSARLVASWDTLPEHATALGKAIAAL